MDSKDASSLLDQMIDSFLPAGSDISFEDDSNNSLFAAVAQFANQSNPLPETPEEIDAYLESIPLFATKMPEEGKESDAFKALKQLQQETGVTTPTADETQTVESCKERGNNAYKLALRLDRNPPGETKDAEERRITARKKKIYEALNWYYTAVENKHTLEKDDRSDEDKNRVLSLVYGNIAAGQAMLHNYGYVIENCKQAIKLYKGNIKAYYRMAQSLFSLHKYEQSFIILQQGLQQCIIQKEPIQYQLFYTLAQKIVHAWRREEEYRQQKLQEKQQQLIQLQQEQEQLAQILQKRKINFVPSQFNLASYTTQYSGGKMYVGIKKELHFPIIILYPHCQQSDFIQDVDEYTSMQQILQMLFPIDAPSLPWDTKNQYRLGNLDVWVKTGAPEFWGEDSIRIDNTADQQGQKLIVPLKVGLGHALTALCKQGYKVPKFPTFCVTPKQ